MIDTLDDVEPPYRFGDSVRADRKGYLTASARRATMEATMGNAWGDEMQEIEARIEHSTDKAWLVIDNMSGEQAWLPKSAGVIIKDADPDGNVLFRAPTRWLRHVKFIS